MYRRTRLHQLHSSASTMYKFSLFLVFSSLSPAHGNVALNELFSSGMVLQGGADNVAKIYGTTTSPAGETVTVLRTFPSGASDHFSASSSSGSWVVPLPLPPAGEALLNITLQVSGTSNASHVIIIRNVAYGTVILCVCKSSHPLPRTHGCTPPYV